MLSIIIPALNEEEYLPKLLDSLKCQKGIEHLRYEIIVADAGSSDRTREIASRYGCVVVKGGIPAKGRNEGARIARGELYLFLDADVELPDNFLKNALDEFFKRKLSAASFLLRPRHWFPRLLFGVFYNAMAMATERVLPHGAMGILVRKPFFYGVGGFDETLTLAEDYYFVRQVAKHGKFGIIRSVSIVISLRRFWTDGWVRTALVCLLCELHMIFIGPVRSDIFHYRFNHYKR
ncbi:MAG: glycosyltransferase [Candidatus Wildermuthbacteria bacterium]|nr:glycosyltransferase [Candidatus Wildermuthbacteria bacterium]